ncbi:MAG: hypothetical protein FJW40_00770 [Acidobacteria bacterium]|nr:hypothetical protein [Acidobacteriota bacterium]
MLAIVTFTVAFLVFAGCGMAAGYYIWSVPQRELAQSLTGRLRELRSRAGGARKRGATDLLRREEASAFGFLTDLFSGAGILGRLQDHIDQANLPHRATNVLALCIGLFAGIFLLFGLGVSGLLLLRLALSVAIGYIPIAYVGFRRSARLARFEHQLPDAIDLFNRSMKAGHNIHAGLDTIAQESLEPVKMEFKKVVEELALGSPTEQALHNLGKRIPLLDLKFFITGLILQRQTGANMVEMLENLALLIRERLNLAEKLKAGTAQQRLSAGLLCAFPIIVGLVVSFLKPEYTQFLLNDPLGNNMLTYAIISESLGILIIRQLSKPKF